MRKPYPSDLTDDQWSLIEPLIPVNSLGRPRTVDMREILNAILYVNRSGCQWDMLPHDFPPKSTVYDYFAQWTADGTWQKILDALRAAVRVAGGHDPNPSVLSIDSQTVKATRTSGQRGYDAGKKSTASSGTSWWPHWGCCSRWSSIRRTSRTVMGPNSCSPRPSSWGPGRGWNGSGPTVVMRGS